MYRSLGRFCRVFGVFLLAAVVVTAIFLANASPPDPTWIAGFYDDGDHDDAVLALLAIDGVVVEPILAAATTGVVESLVPADVAPGPAPHAEAPRSRAPPLSPPPA